VDPQETPHPGRDRAKNSVSKWHIYLLDLPIHTEDS